MMTIPCSAAAAVAAAAAAFVCELVLQHADGDSGLALGAALYGTALA